MKHQTFPHSKKKISILSQRSIEKYINYQLFKKYFKNEHCYPTNVINNIMYNEKSLIVAKFKDFLILDDPSEFLKRYYTSFESSIRLPKFYEYYENFNSIYPNYNVLPESKYLYKNIHKKQKMIDLQREMELSSRETNLLYKDNHHYNIKSEEIKMFSTEIYSSIAKNTSSLKKLFSIDKNCDSNRDNNDDINRIIKQIEKFTNVIKPNKENNLNIMQFNQFSKNVKDINKKNGGMKSMNITLYHHIKFGNMKMIKKNRKLIISNNSKDIVYNKQNKNYFQNLYPLTECTMNNDKETSKVNVKINYSKGKRISKEKNPSRSKNYNNNNFKIIHLHNNLLNRKGTVKFKSNIQLKTKRNDDNINKGIKNIQKKNVSVNVIEKSFSKNKNRSKRENHNNTIERYKTERHESTFDSLLNMKESDRKKKKKKGREKSNLNTNLLASTFTSRNSSISKNKSIRHQLKYGSSYNSNNISGINEKKTQNSINENSNAKLIITLKSNSRENSIQTNINKNPLHKKKMIIKGIHINNFNKVFGLYKNDENLKYDIHNQSNNSRFTKINNL